ncbi:MAG TPA: D-aminoacyl-tRNA deacylase [Phycisphaerae bacterium]|nr:D-aminoacyl-tRNA deacylase [Phycisphaerae bacterium]
MRAIVQRVSNASVEIAGEVVARIDRGLLVYLGVAADDVPKDAEQLATKIAHLRIFEDDARKMNRDVADVGGEILVVSNFTLLADTRQGRRPSFIAAAKPDTADPLYQLLCQKLRDFGRSVQTGRFREYMAVRSTNDGPINILLDTREPGA